MNNFDDKLFSAHLSDMISLCDKRYSMRFTGFLTEEEQEFAEEFFKRKNFEDFLFYGGFDGAERKILCVYPCDMEVSGKDFPISIVKFSFREKDTVTHPQVLGSVMSLGIKRETVGDIIIENGCAYVICAKDTKSLIDGIEKIGKVGVKSEILDEFAYEKEDKFEEKRITVSSLRLDNVLSAATGLSRTKANELIKSDGAAVCHREVFSPDTLLCEGDVFSVRKKGKYILSEICGETKKGKIAVLIKKYM